MAASTMLNVGKNAYGVMGEAIKNYSGMGKAGKVGVAALMVGAGIKGLYDAVAPAAIDASMDIAFGDPQADKKVLGTDLTPSLMYGASGLPGAGYARSLNPAKYGIGAKGGPIRNTAKSGALGSLIGGSLGALSVAAAAHAAKLPINPAKLMKTGIKGAAIGAAIGGTAGLFGTVSSTVMSANANQQIMAQSPFYNQSALTAERLNASGNIVLGMHNTRRG
jgi:hypothetical protein